MSPITRAVLVNSTTRDEISPLTLPATRTASHTTEPLTTAASPTVRLRLVTSPSMMPSRSEEHTSELQSLMRISYAVFCLKKNNHNAMRADYRAIERMVLAADFRKSDALYTD